MLFTSLDEKPVTSVALAPTHCKPIAFSYEGLAVG